MNFWCLLNCGIVFFITPILLNSRRFQLRSHHSLALKITACLRCEFIYSSLIAKTPVFIFWSTSQNASWQLGRNIASKSRENYCFGATLLKVHAKRCTTRWRVGFYNWGEAQTPYRLLAAFLGGAIRPTLESKSLSQAINSRLIIAVYLLLSKRVFKGPRSSLGW